MAVATTTGGVEVAHATTIARAARDLYGFWRNAEALRSILPDVESVEPLAPNRTRWVARGAGGRQVEWITEVIDDRPNERIEWRAQGGADVEEWGSIEFGPAPAERGTEVVYRARYSSAGTDLRGALSRLLGGTPAANVAHVLRRFKQVMEAGEIATTAGQPAGRCA
jgi:uncharacterized membrane protein